MVSGNEILDVTRVVVYVGRLSHGSGKLISDPEREKADRVMKAKRQMDNQVVRPSA
jgi:hypothetical protein